MPQAMLAAVFALGCATADPGPAGAPPAPATDRAPATVRSALPLPAGATRLPTDAFGDWLGDRPLADPATPVRTHDGHPVAAPHAPPTARVLVLPLVAGDLQQCADAAYRLRADFLRAQGASDIPFHATNGQALPWGRWSRGERARLRGDRLVWEPGPAGTDDAQWEAWLRTLFTYAGTRSLAAHDTVPVADGVPRAGDVVVAPGSPGHAVLLLDVARDAEGQLLVIFGEGFMPAQDFHVHHGPIDGWWPWSPTAGLSLDWWTLPASGLRRWR